MSLGSRPRQLEVRVLDLVDHILAGNRIEDDLVECKGQWPCWLGQPRGRRLGAFAACAQVDGASPEKCDPESCKLVIALSDSGQAVTSMEPAHERRRPPARTDPDPRSA